MNQAIFWRGCLSFGFGATLLLSAGSTKAADDRVKIDNEQARVLVVSTADGAKSAPHEHKVNRVMIYLDEGRMTLTDERGRVETLKFKAGEALWSPATGMHVSENLSGHTVRIAEVEIKPRPSEAAEVPLSALDPVKVDPRRYKVEFENRAVRVLRARYGPHEKGVLHEHTLNRVVAYLTDARMKVTTAEGNAKVAVNHVGDVAWGGKAKHVEENLNDTPFEVVVVEFKR